MTARMLQPALLGIFCLILLGGCGTTKLVPVPFVDVGPPAGGPDPVDADAVVLLQHQRFATMNPKSGRGSSEQQFHRVVKVLTEGGFSAGSTHVVVPAGATLVDLRARTITPKGESIPVDVSAILSSTYETGGDSGDTRSFQFPRVEVGSILEYTWIIRQEFAWWSLTDDVAEEFPIRDYRVEIVVDKYVVPDLLVNNAKPALALVVDGDGTQRLSFALKDVAALPKEDHRPSNRELTPWWIYRAIEWRYPNQVSPGISTWSRAVGALHTRLVDGKDMGAFTIRGADACEGSDHRCLISAALQTLHADVALSGFTSSLDGRPLAEVKASKAGNSAELALALWQMLRDKGLEPRLAPTSRPAFMAINESFPASTWFNHLLVFVPDPDGAGIWIDPSCESCQPGTLPNWSHGTRAITLSEVAGERGGELRASAFMTATGQLQAASVITRKATMRISEAGDVDVDITINETGSEAVDTIVNNLDDDENTMRETHSSVASETSKSATVTRSSRWTCDRSRSTCSKQYGFRILGFGTLSDDGKSIIVPPAGLRAPLEWQLKEDDTRRRRLRRIAAQSRRGHLQ